MSTIVIGIDGLELGIINKYISELPGFQILKDKGALNAIPTVFPADSVPAWLTIFTGLNPAQHGIVRGKDYVESVEEYEKSHTIKLAGKTFWDHLSKQGKKCLILNPFLAYPAWSINGLFISGPAFVDGSVTQCGPYRTQRPEVYGGYAAVGTVAELKQDMDSAFSDTKGLWQDFEDLFYKDGKKAYDFAFVTFTTLDRIQHYTWRYFDVNDPLYKYDDYLSDFIPKSLRYFDNCIQNTISKMEMDDNLIVISDHGFRQRPYKLINFNEIFRKAGLLEVNKSAKKNSTIFKQKLKTCVVKVLSDFRLLDVVVPRLKKVKAINKYKKSDFLIDKSESIVYVDQLFSGKKPYVGLNFGEKIKKLSDLERRQVFEKVKSCIVNSNIPSPLWIKYGRDLYRGEFEENIPDICLELPGDYGVEFDMFGPEITTSSTHYKLSGGHYGNSTFGFYNKGGNIHTINHVADIYSLVVQLETGKK